MSETYKHVNLETTRNQNKLVLQTLTDIKWVGGSRAAIPVSSITFHFIHLAAVQFVVQADGSSTECSTLEWEEKRIIADQYLLDTLQQIEGSGSYATAASG